VKPFLLAEVEYRAKSAHGKLRRPSLIACVRSDHYRSQPPSSLVSDTLNEGVDLVIVVAAGKFQELTDTRP